MEKIIRFYRQVLTNPPCLAYDGVIKGGCMSQTDYAVEPDPALWETYLSECRALGVRPSLSDYVVWLSEQDIDDYYQDEDHDFVRGE